MTGLEPLLLGAVATAGTASTAATALTVLSAGFSIAQGVMGFQAARQERAQVKAQKQVVRTQAAQREEQRQRSLNEMLATQRSMFAGRGVDSGVGTPINLALDTEEQFKRDATTDFINTQNQMQQLRLQSRQLRLGGFSSLLQGFGSAAGTIGSSGLRASERNLTIG